MNGKDCEREFLHFLKLHPDGSRLPDSCERLPLIYGIVGGCTDVVNLLIKAYPHGVSRSIGDDSHAEKRLLPIHHAATCGYEKIIQLLLETRPDTISQRDGKGDLPLHRAIRAGHGLSAKLLVDTYPDGVKVKGENRVGYHFIVLQLVEMLI